LLTGTWKIGLATANEAVRGPRDDYRFCTVMAIPLWMREGVCDPLVSTACTEPFSARL